MDKEFKSSPKNILRIVGVSDNFLKAWEEGFVRAKTMLESLYGKEPDKAAFKGKYYAEIKLYPEIWYKNPQTGEWEDRDDIYTVMTGYLDPHKVFNMIVNYDPSTKDESGFWDNINVSRELNWNNCCGMPHYFESHYLCYAIHELYDHNHWTFQDIAKINNIVITVEVSDRGEMGIF